MTPKAAKRVAKIEQRYASSEPEIWRVYIEGTMFGSPTNIRKEIHAAIKKTAEALPGVRLLRVTARQRNHKPTPVRIP
jgi:hypothetical protein